MTLIAALLLACTAPQQEDLLVNELAKNWTDTIDRCVREQQWGRLVDLLDRVPSDMMLKDGTSWRPARDVLLKRHFTRGSDALRVWRTRHDAAAKKLFNEARKARDEREARRMIRLFFPSSVGDDAADWLANRLHARARNPEAIALWRRILDDHPDSDIPAVAIAARLAVAGHTAEALRRTDERVRVADGTKTLGELVASLGKPERPKRKRASVPVPLPRIAARERDFSEDGSALWQGNESGPPFRVAVVGKNLAYTTGARVVVFDPEKREPVWSDPPEYDSVRRPRNGSTAWPRGGVTVNDNRLFVTLVSEDRPELDRRRRHGLPFEGCRIIRSYDAVKGELLWQTDLEELKFPNYILCGAPLVSRDRVYLAVSVDRGTERESGVVALDADTGKRIWYRYICTRFIPQRRNRRWYQPPVVVPASLAAGGDRIVVHTSGDAVASLRRADGQIQWISRLSVPHSRARTPGRPVIFGSSIYIADAGDMGVYRVDLYNGHPELLKETSDIQRLWRTQDGRILFAGSRSWTLDPGTGEKGTFPGLDLTDAPEPFSSEGVVWLTGRIRSRWIVARYRLADWSYVDQVELRSRDQNAQPLLVNQHVVLAGWVGLSVFRYAEEESPISTTPKRNLPRLVEKRMEMGDPLTAGRALLVYREGATEEEWKTLKYVRWKVRDALRSAIERRHLAGLEAVAGLRPYFSVYVHLTEDSDDVLWARQLEGELHYLAGEWKKALPLLQTFLKIEGGDFALHVAQNRARLRVHRILTEHAPELAEGFRREAERLLQAGAYRRIRREFPGTAATEKAVVIEATRHSEKKEWVKLFADVLEVTRPYFSDETAWKIRKIVQDALPRIEDASQAAELRRAMKVLSKRRPKY